MLIQIGGLGLVTLTSFFNLVVGKKLGLRGMKLASESINSTSFGDVPHLLRMIFYLYLDGGKHRSGFAGTLFCARLWVAWGVYRHLLGGVGFCNAGFDILGFWESTPR